MNGLTASNLYFRSNHSDRSLERTLWTVVDLVDRGNMETYQCLDSELISFVSCRRQKARLSFSSVPNLVDWWQSASETLWLLQLARGMKK